MNKTIMANLKTASLVYSAEHPKDLRIKKILAEIRKCSEAGKGVDASLRKLLRQQAKDAAWDGNLISRYAAWAFYLVLMDKEDVEAEGINLLEAIPKTVNRALERKNGQK